MEELKKDIQTLAQKQSHVRKSFKEWLEKWKTVTKDIDTDSYLLYTPLATEIEDVQWENEFYLKIGDEDIWKRCVSIDSPDYNYIDIDNLDMKLIREMLRRLPEQLENFKNDVTKITLELETFIDQLHYEKGKTTSK